MANSAFKKLFEPGQIGSVRIKNRIVKMGAQFTPTDWEDGYIQQRYIDLFEAIARGGVGLITVAGSEIGKDVFYDGFLVTDDKYIPRLRETVDAIHKWDCPAFMQVMHYGPMMKDPIASTALSREEYPMSLALPRAVTVPEIKTIVREFGDHAERIRKAGFDGIEFNCGALHFINTFLSPAWNKRQDEYGGSTENRARIVLEIIKEMKERNGKDFPITVLFNAAEPGLAGGITIAEAQKLAKLFEVGGADAIQARIECYTIRKSRRWQTNGFMNYDNTHFPDVALNPEPPSGITKDTVDASHHGAGAWVPAAAAIKKVVNIPVIAVGRLDAEMGERMLRQGMADFIYINRRLIADHDYPNKIKEGRLKDIAPCTACMTCFAQFDFYAKYPGVFCRVNAAAGKEKEYELKPAAKKKKVMVIGGGPAGMEAARVAALRGHHVTLFEKERLGGSANVAAVVKGTEKEDILNLVDYLKVQINKAGVDVREGQEATIETVQQIKPDVVIVATGGKHNDPDIPGINRKNVLTGQILHDQLKKYMKLTGAGLMTKLVKQYVPVGKNVVIIGGGIHGCQTAEFLVKRGRKVAIVENGPNIGEGLLTHLLKPQLLDYLEKKDVVIMANVKYEEITDKGLTIVNEAGERQLIAADTILTALPLLPDTKLAESLKDIVPEIHAIGDCSLPAYIANAINEGSKIAREI